MRNQLFIFGTTLLTTFVSVKGDLGSYLDGNCYACTSPQDNNVFYYCSGDNKCYDSASSCTSGTAYSTIADCMQNPNLVSAACSTIKPDGQPFQFTLGPQKACSFQLGGAQASFVLQDTGIDAYVGVDALPTTTKNELVQ